MLPPSRPPTRRDESSLPGSESILSGRRLGPYFELGGKTRLRVRVTLAFLLIAGVPGIAGGVPRVALYATIVFLALLAHELGHALCGVWWGSQATIVLHVLGGDTAFEPHLPRRREIIAALAGPCVNLVIALTLAVICRIYPVRHWVTVALWVNLVWGVVNWLPIVPFDGGRVLLAMLDDRRRSSALLGSGALALVVSIGGLFWLRNAGMLLVFGACAFASLFDWTKLRRAEAERELGLPQLIARARQWLASGELERSRRLGVLIARRARTNATAKAGWEIVAWSELGLDRFAAAHESLGRVRPASDVDSYCLAAVEAARGQSRRAISLLESGWTGRTRCTEATKLLIDLHAGLGALDRACAVASSELGALGPEDVRRVIDAAFEASAIAPATKLAGELFGVTGDPEDAFSQAYGLARLGDRTNARRVFRQLATLLSNWQMHTKTLARLRDLAARPDSSDIIGPELRLHLQAHVPSRA
jgi:Zn-dependent protease